MSLPQTEIAKNKESSIFFRTWLRSPKTMGSIVPSSKHYARALFEACAYQPGRTIVELGGGTGSISEGFLDCGVHPEDLVTIELDPELHRFLRQRLPQAVRVINGDATKLRDIVAEYRLDDVSSIVCGVPVVTMSLEFQRALMMPALELLGPNGYVVQLSYSPFPPLKHKALGVNAHITRFVPRNIPPAFVWKISQRAGNGHV